MTTTIDTLVFDPNSRGSWTPSRVVIDSATGTVTSLTALPATSGPLPLLTPSLKDHHVHLTSTAKMATHFHDLSSLTTIESLREWASDPAHVYGFLWTCPASIDLHSFDFVEAVFGGQCPPKVVFARDLHSCVASLAFLERMGLFNTIDGHGPRNDGRPGRDSPNEKDLPRNGKGAPTGLMSEALVFRAQGFALSEATFGSAEMGSFVRLALSHGITSVISMEDESGAGDLLRECAGGGGDLDVSMFLMGEESLTRAESGQLGPEVARSPLVRGFKFFYDGSLGSDTALMDEPFEHCAHCGRGLLTRGKLLELCERSERLGLPVAVHAIGDRACEEVVDVLTRAERPPELVHRVEHFEFCNDRTRAMLSDPTRREIVLSMQPCHLFEDSAPGARKLGPDRLKRLGFRLRTLLDLEPLTGNRMVFGTDTPVEPINPMRNLTACESVWDERERLTRWEAMARCTGTLSLGVSQGDKADLCLWPAELMSLKGNDDATRAAIEAIRPLKVFKGGRMVQ
jgi:predicted amidohydrolase YtcJ